MFVIAFLTGLQWVGLEKGNVMARNLEDCSFLTLTLIEGFIFGFMHSLLFIYVFFSLVIHPAMSIRAFI